MSGREEEAPERKKGGDNANWANTNLTELKNKGNPNNQFSMYKWMGEI
jgi:hypothetical protein